MRIAIVSDIHGNRTALDAVIKDLGDTSPDLIFHGGDLADSGSSPAEVIDQVRDLSWPGVLGNTDEVHTRPESLEEFASQSSAPASLWAVVREMAAATHAALGEERVSWMRTLPLVQVHDFIALVHARPESAWQSPGSGASSAELENCYGPLNTPLVVFGHIHQPFIRTVHTANRKLTVANTGSVSLSYDGDCRASYLLIDDGCPTIRRVEYDVEKEVRALAASRLPYSDWVAGMLRAAKPLMP